MVQLRGHGKPEELSKIAETKPLPFKDEYRIIEGVETPIKILRKRCKFSQKDDEKILNDPSASTQMKFAVILRSERRKVIDDNLAMIQIIKHILQLLQNGVSLKKAYLTPIPKVEDKLSFVELVKRRAPLKEYLKQLGSISKLT
jgi:hypothetical protein